MSAAWTHENLNDYLDDRLTPADRSQLETVIRNDAAAIEALRELRQMRIELRKANRFQLDADFAARVVSAIASPSKLLSSADQSAADAALTVPVPGTPVPAPPSAMNWRGAAAIILTLAASLLVIVLTRPSLVAPAADSVAKGDQDRADDAPPNPGNADRSIDRGLPGPGETSRMDEPAGVKDVEAPTPPSAQSAAAASGGGGAGQGGRQANESVSQDETRSFPAPSRPVDKSGNEKNLDPSTTPEPYRFGAVLEMKKDEAGNAGELAAVPESRAGNETAMNDPPAPAAAPAVDAEESSSLALESNGQGNVASGNSPAGITPMAFDEILVVQTTAEQKTRLVNLLDAGRTNQLFADLDRNQPGLQFLRKKESEQALGGVADAPAPAEPLESFREKANSRSVTNDYISIEATSQQLEELLAKLGAPTSRMVESGFDSSLSISEWVVEKERGLPFPAVGNLGADEKAGAGIGNDSGQPGQAVGGGEDITAPDHVVARRLIPDASLNRRQQNDGQRVAGEKPADAVPAVKRRYLLILEVVPVSETRPSGK
jgi:hypothetical protein